MKEVKESCYAGPFDRPPCKYYVQLPLGLIPKLENKTRLIFHLSYDFGTKLEERSINFHTLKEYCTVKYKDLEHAIQESLRLLQQMGRQQTGSIFYSKTDCSNAFHLAPILIRQRYLLVMSAIHPVTKRKYFFVDKCLPFGSSRSCEIFQAFSDTLAFAAKVHMVREQIVDNPAITNHLDDFLFMALQWIVCNTMMNVFLNMCNHIGCPISRTKLKKPRR